jgi:hypothetical protein
MHKEKGKRMIYSGKQNKRYVRFSLTSHRLHLHLQSKPDSGRFPYSLHIPSEDRTPLQCGKFIVTSMTRISFVF